MKRLDWAVILIMDTPFVFVLGRRMGLPWRVMVPFWWRTSRAMWRYGE